MATVKIEVEPYFPVTLGNSEVTTQVYYLKLSQVRDLRDRLNLVLEGGK